MSPTNSTLADIAGLVRDTRRVLLLCHISPDGDAVGAMLGLGWLLAALPQPPAITLACADPIPSQLHFLPGVERITRDPQAGPWDAVVGLDASDAERLGSIFRPAAYGAAPVIVLDHHITNAGFGTMNYVDLSAAATSQIVADLADALGVFIGREAAVCLLTGIVTDTLSFRTNNVTPAVVSAAARLMEAGANLAEIAHLTLDRRPVSVVRLWGLALSQVHLEAGVLWTAIPLAMREQAGVNGDEDGSLVSYLINAEEARIAAVFRERDGGKVEIGLRSRRGYDVSAVAFRLGGGGHPQAAGCTVQGTLADVEAHVLPMLIAATQGTGRE